MTFSCGFLHPKQDLKYAEEPEKFEVQNSKVLPSSYSGVSPLP